ncbi:MAG: CHAD domain-containing protein [bacterium]
MSHLPKAKCQRSAERALRAVPDWFSHEFEPALDDFLTTASPEGPHKTRVALRQLRSVLTGFSAIIKPKTLDRLQRRIRHYFRLIGQVRDADVLLRHVTDKAAIKSARKQAAELRMSVRAKLKARDVSEFSSDLARLLRGKSWRRGSKTAKRLRHAPCGTLATAALQTAFLKCRNYPRDLSVLTRHDLHSFRKDLKTLRYMAEYFAFLWPDAAQNHYFDKLRCLQDELGDLIDAELIRQRGLPGIAPEVRTMDAACDHWQALLDLEPMWAAATP